MFTSPHMSEVNLSRLEGVSRQFGALLGLAAAIFIMFALWVHPIHAATCTYQQTVGSGTGDFNTAANWNCGFVPGSTSTAIIPAATSTNMSATVTVSNLQLNASSTLTTFGQILNVTDSVSSTGGTIAAGGSAITVGNDWIFMQGAIFTAATSTVNFTTSTAGGFTHIITTDAATFTFFNLTVTSTVGTGGVLFSSSSTVTAYTIGGYASTTLNGGTLSLVTPNTLTITGAYLNNTAFSLGAASTLTVTATTTNTGLGNFTQNAGTFTFNGDFVASSTGVNLTGSTGTFNFNKGLTNPGGNVGYFSSGSSTAVFGGSVSQVIPTSTFFNLTVNSSGGTVTFSGDATTTGNFAYTAGSLTLGPGTLTAYGNMTGTGTNASTGAVNLRGANSQSIGFDVLNILNVNKTGGTATFTNVAHSFNSALNLIGGTLNAGTAVTTLAGTSLSPFVMAGGTFLHGSGTVSYNKISGGTVTVASTTYNNLAFAPFLSSATVFALNGPTNASGTTSLSNVGAALNISTYTFTAVGLITNVGLMYKTSGTIIHAAESKGFTDSAGVAVLSYTNPASVYVTVQDSNLNLSGTTTESFTIPVTFNAAAGSDAETITLTETTVSSGIFRNASAVNLVSSTISSPGNNQLELVATGVGTATYIDAQDSTDSGSGTVTLTFEAASAAATTGGGGLSSGGGGGGGMVPIVTTFQSNTVLLQNLKNIGVAINSLVKLPDDKNINTQEDSAVYYVGSDGKRHAFPNDKVYFTWYMDFSGVQVVNSQQLASIPLGANVTYKPGKKMVKFATDPKVYVVAKGGILRWVTTEAAATALYGSNWNTKIDDINDAFYANYSFGNNVTGLPDFNPVTVEASVTVPSDSLVM